MYEINISKNGEHYFSVTKKSVQNVCTTLNFYKQLAHHFKPKHGYKITVQHVVDPE